jgi:hypothetical protein
LGWHGVCKNRRTHLGFRLHGTHRPSISPPAIEQIKAGIKERSATADSR